MTQAAGVLLLLALLSVVPGQTTAVADRGLPDRPAADHAVGYYDPTLQRVVLVGGPGDARAEDRDRVWSWSGTRWEMVTTAGPIARVNASAAYDATRRRAVIAGGAHKAGAEGAWRVLSDGWEGDGAGWRPGASIPARDHHALVEDGRGGVLLFGGIPSDRSSSWPTDTWRLEPSGWRRIASNGPAPRGRTALAYDSRRGQVVLFGGVGEPPAPRAAQPFFGDTWLWNGDQWTKAADAGPPGRYAHGMVFDERAGVVLLYSGSAAHRDAPLSDMWQWDGVRWTEIPLVGPTPGHRYQPVMVYDKARGRTVLFGGRAGSYDTWEWDGSAWREISPDPPAVDMSAMNAFWHVFDVFQSGTEPSAAAWQGVFESSGYQSYVRSARMERMFRETWPVAFSPGRESERETLQAAQPAYAAYLLHFAAVARRAGELKAFQASLASSDFQQRARARALEYLPAEAGQDVQWPRIVPVIAEPDGRAVGDTIVIDLLMAADLGELLIDFVAHEMHHVYGRRLRTWQRQPDASGPEAPLLQTIDQLALEGIADLVDKPALLNNGGPYADRFRAALETADTDIENMNLRLEGIAANAGLMQENAIAIWRSLPFAGHTTGYYMAQTIRDGLGAVALDACVRNPFAFIPTYNAAAQRINARGQHRPLFSEASLSVIAGLESKARRAAR